MSSAFLFGLPVYLNPHMVEHTAIVSWIDKVLLWNPCNDFPLKWVTMPTEVIYQSELGFVMHPDTFRKLQREAKL